MKQETAAPTGDERVAFTLRLDGSLDFDAEAEAERLARHLGVKPSKISKNDLVVRALRFYLAAPEAERMNWKPSEPAPPPVPAPAASANGANGKKGR